MPSRSGADLDAPRPDPDRLDRHRHRQTLERQRRIEMPDDPVRRGSPGTRTPPTRTSVDVQPERPVSCRRDGSEPAPRSSARACPPNGRPPRIRRARRSVTPWPAGCPCSSSSQVVLRQGRALRILIAPTSRIWSSPVSTKRRGSKSRPSTSSRMFRTRRGARSRWAEISPDHGVRVRQDLAVALPRPGGAPRAVADRVREARPPRRSWRPGASRARSGAALPRGPAGPPRAAGCGAALRMPRLSVRQRVLADHRIDRGQVRIAAGDGAAEPLELRGGPARTLRARLEDDEVHAERRPAPRARHA